MLTAKHICLSQNVMTRTWMCSLPSALHLRFMEMCSFCKTPFHIVHRPVSSSTKPLHHDKICHLINVREPLPLSSVLLKHRRFLPAAAESQERLSPEKLDEHLVKTTYNELLVEPKKLSAVEWTEIGSKFEQSRHLRSRWPSVLLNYIAHITAFEPGLYNLGMSLVDYVTSLSPRHNILRLVATIAICVHQGGESRHELAFKAYDELRTIYDTFDASSALILIYAFSKTRLWRHCADLIEMVKVTSTPGGMHYSPFVIAAMVNGDSSLADKLLLVMSNDDLEPTEEMYAALIDLGMTEKLLDILQQFSWIPSKKVADRLVEYFESQSSEKWHIDQVTKTSIDKDGHCRCCRMPLKQLQRISNDDFTRLQTMFLQKSLMRDGNVFLGSSPEEVTAFQKFLEHRKSSHFDLILDGLNIAHVAPQKSTTRHKDYVLEQVIKYFIQRGGKILVLGRKHMKRWKSAKIENSHVAFFFTENISSDDPFMLYAALYSGQNTYIMTNDELRDNRFLLGSELASKLKIWQRGHQVMFGGLWPNNVLKFKWPDVHETVVQQNNGNWHIPFESGKPRTSFQLPQTWYCVSKRL